MTKKIKINCCDECPNRTWSKAELTIHLGYETLFFFREGCKPLEYTNIIPEWCPLPEDV